MGRSGMARMVPVLCLALVAACSADHSVRATRSVEVGSVDSVPAPSTSAADEPSPPETSPPTTAPPTAPPTVPQSTPPSTEPTVPPGGLVPNGDGVGDQLFPDLGNPGIDVLDYALDLTYDRDADSIAGSVTLTMQITDERGELTLDSSGPEVSSVTVDGVDARYVEDDPELRITPAATLHAGDVVEVRVEYSVVPSFDDGDIIPSGWFNTPAGSYVLNEPDGASSWLPSNDHPSDKATWTFEITVAPGATAVANGALVSSTDGPDGATWVWREDDPMPTYLMLLVTGDYEIVEGTTPDGLPLVSAVLRSDRQRAQPYLDSLDDQIDFFDDWFGPFPLDRYGIAITDSFGGLAMETQGRSLFSRDDLNGDSGPLQELLLSHELAHQWFGDAVSPLQWRDIWLNESFATYGQWMWLEHVQQGTVEGEAERSLDGRLAQRGNPTGSPDADDLFGFNSYDGGAVVLHALRRTIGDDHFFDLLQRWVAENTGTSRSTQDFIALAEEVSGTDLEEFFDDWLFATKLPSAYPSAPAGQ
ncbi:MAG: M1 family metallopeptidase [Ilumatobacteraceae bacterium]